MINIKPKTLFFFSLKNPCDKGVCSPVFGFKHQLTITDDGEKFKTAVKDTTISGNIDSPEGGFDALMQIAVCQVEACLYG